MRFLQQGKQRLQRRGRDLNSVRSWSSLLSRRPFHQFLVQQGGGGGGGLAHMKDNCAVFCLFLLQIQIVNSMWQRLTRDTMNHSDRLIQNGLVLN